MSGICKAFPIQSSSFHGGLLDKDLGKSYSVDKFNPAFYYSNDDNANNKSSNNRPPLYWLIDFARAEHPRKYVNKITNWIPIFRAIGAVTTITLNILLIPIYGVLGSAWATVLGFLFMTLSLFIKLIKTYKIRYNWIAILYPVLIIISISL